MDMRKDGFWDYAGRWHGLFSEEKKLQWEGNWLENEFCSSCRFCCGHQDSDVPFPMPLQPAQSGRKAADKFHLLDFHTAYLARAGCKSDSINGCRLKAFEKPIACGLFPVVFANGHLYLYQNCPAVICTPLIRFMEFAKKAAEMLYQLSESELWHLSICLPLDTIARAYIDLRICLIDQQGKKSLIFE